MTFDSMIDDDLCIDLDAEFALMDAPTLDPDAGTGSMLAIPTPEHDSQDWDETFLSVTAYA